MIIGRIVTFIVFAVTIECGSSYIQAQQPQIPTLQGWVNKLIHAQLRRSIGG